METYDELQKELDKCEQAFAKELQKLNLKEAWVAIGREEVGAPKDALEFLCGILIKVDGVEIIRELNKLQYFIEQTQPLNKEKLLTKLADFKSACIDFYRAQLFL
jgi:hypothetical protein